MRVLAKATVSSQPPAVCSWCPLAKPGGREAESVGEQRELVVPAARLLDLPPLNIGSFRHSRVGQSSILHLGAAAKWIWVAIRIECCLPYLALSISDRHLKISPRVPRTTHCHATNSRAMEKRSSGTCGSSSHPTRKSKLKLGAFQAHEKTLNTMALVRLILEPNGYWISFSIP